MRTETRTVRLHRAQADFRHSPALYRGFVGGRGSGKSWVGAYDLLRRAKRGRTYLICGPTYTVLRDSSMRSFLDLARDFGVIDPAHLKKSPPPELTLTTGAEVLFRSADDPERLRGPNFSGAWMDEASLMGRAAYDIVIACLRQAGEQGWLSATFTPKGLSHWTYDLFGRATPDTAIFHATTRDNPFNPPGFADTLALQYGVQLARQEIGGEFVNVAGAEWPAEYFPESLWFADYPERLTVTALALDPSQGKGEKKKGCYSTFAFVGVDPQGVAWCEAWMSQQWDASQLVDQAFTLTAAARPMALAVELNGGQSFLASMLFKESRLRKKDLPLHGITNYTDKEVRIRSGLGPLLAQGRLRFRDTPGTRTLLQQTRDFPVGEYTDGPDALEMALRMAAHLRGQGGRGGPTLLRA
jgi:predicted phage terminase large subunit-like protein